MAQAVAPSGQGRPEVTIYWQPSCSSCLKAKEFVASLGVAFESLNVRENPDALEEIMAAGLRGVPVVRKGDKFVYAQSLDDLAALFGTTRKQSSLPKQVLVDRWVDIQEKARVVIESFDATALDQKLAARGPHATIKELAEHAFQVIESFLRQVEDDTIDARAIYLHPDETIRTRQDLLNYVDGIQREYATWRANGGPEAMPARLNTHYGNQLSDRVLERGVWHMAQHARQLDHLAADMGGALRIPAALYEGLPLPESLWT